MGTALCFDVEENNTIGDLIDFAHSSNCFVGFCFYLKWTRPKRVPCRAAAEVSSNSRHNRSTQHRQQHPASLSPPYFHSNCFKHSIVSPICLASTKPKRLGPVPRECAQYTVPFQLMNANAPYLVGKKLASTTVCVSKKKLALFSFFNE